MRQAQQYGGASSKAALTALTVFAVAMFVFIMAPLIVIIVGSFTTNLYLSFPPPELGLRWYRELSEQSRWATAAWNTIKIGVPVALISVVLGTLVALAMARCKTATIVFIGGIFIAPMMLPHIIIAIGLYPTIIDLGLSNTFAAVIFGHVVVATPFVVLTVTASLKGYSETLEMAAMTLGANPWKVFQRVTFPMIKTGIGVGGLFAFATSFDELMLSLFLTGAKTETLPRLIWEHLFYTLTPVVAAAATFILAFSLLLLWIAVSVRNESAPIAKVAAGVKET
jgi:ABC-type spermidine/putrescine transport system permease subunit II